MNKKQQYGFTLIEAGIATTILTIVFAMVLSGTMYALKENLLLGTQAELDMDAELTIERLKYDMRLSSLDEMYFYPTGAGPYQAVSFPLAVDDDGDGIFETDGDGKLIWDQTLIYHIRPGDPDQLRITTFSPRDTTLTDAERQAQLNSVVATGDGSSTHNGDNASSRVLFENLLEWQISPQSVYDGYAAELRRDPNGSLGYCLLGPGSHTFKFTTIEKNVLSSNYWVGIDQLTMSSSHSSREAEDQLPATAQSGALAQSLYMPGGGWSGNHLLSFQASNTGQTFSITLYNDQWEETNFRGIGYDADQTVVEFDKTLTPRDFVIKLEGMENTWEAVVQSGSTNYTALSMATNDLRGAAVRLLLRGSEMASGNWISSSGARCRLKFRASGSGYLLAYPVYIAECSSLTNITADAVSGTFQPITFAGNGWTYVAANGSQWSDWIDYPIDKEKSYLVSFILFDHPTTIFPAQWPELRDPTVQDTWMISGTNSPGTAELTAATWSTRSDVTATNGVLGLEAIECSYVEEGTFTSRIFDTTMETPAYNEMQWNAAVPSGCSLTMKVRTGATNDLSDAAVWSNITAVAGSPYTMTESDLRYVQFQATLTSDSSTHTNTPTLKDVTIDWPGEERMVDLGGAFVKGPQYGAFTLEVDGEPVRTSLNVDLEIYKDIRSFTGTKRMTSTARMELRPRNTGK
jgi:type II secretory pathway pseudopilin PulG